MSAWNAVSSVFFHLCLKMIPLNLGYDALQLAFLGIAHVLKRGLEQNPLQGLLHCPWDTAEIFPSLEIVLMHIKTLTEKL